MSLKFTILTYNNFVGIVTDAYLIKDIIYNSISPTVDVKFIDQLIPTDFGDIGIWIQNFHIEHFDKFKKNIFFINEEWVGKYELSNLHLFDYVICKSKYAYELLKSYTNVIYIPFISKNYYDPSICKKDKLLHFAGRSIQKNTELILKQNTPVTLIDPYNRYRVLNSHDHINTYQTTDQIKHILNSHNVHLCTSLYESWGHYLFEGLSTGAEIICSNIPVFTEQLDPDLVHFVPTQLKTDTQYTFDNDNINNKFPLRRSFHMSAEALNYTINNIQFNSNKSIQRINLFHNIINNSTSQLIKFFKQI